ncbi:hypothetical protein CTA2_869, partial [Colletotrichum tanaceti]
MQFANTLAVAASFIAAVSGASVPVERRRVEDTNPATNAKPPPTHFQIMALRPSSPVHYSL